MNSRPEPTKLTELRSKTDRQLAALITSKLDLGLYYARMIARPSSGTRCSPGSFQTNATRAYEEAIALLPWVFEISYPERRRLESRLEDLRELLDESTIHAEMRIEAACS